MSAAHLKHYSKKLPLLTQLEIIEAEESLSEFIRQAWPILEPGAPYVHGWHIDAICEHLEAVTRGEITRLIINIPPGCMKSLILNVFWPAWEWGPKHMPHLRGLGVSHNQDLAVRDSIKLRMLIQSDWYQERYPHVRLKYGRVSKKEFENSKNGFNKVMAIASMTGSRGDRVRIDDPLSVEDARSKIVLATREFLFKEAIPTRLISPKNSAIIIIMQRLHQMDTTGIALKLEQGYECLMLPMEFEIERRCKTNIGFVDPRTIDGELLFPERFPKEVVERDKKSLGAAGHASQNQQRPAPREGAIIQVAWLQNRYLLQRDPYGKPILNSFTEIYQSWDTAFKEGQENDYCVCTTWGLRDNGFYLIHRFKKKMLFPELEARAIELANYFNPNQILIEDAASGISLQQAMQKKTRLPIKAVRADKDKIARLSAVSGYFEAQRVFLPQNESWVDEPDGYVEELTTFPAVAHDDSVDSTSQFLQEIALRRESSLRRIIGASMSR
jgi:predicted phage terminase large subunit-like protein